MLIVLAAAGLLLAQAAAPTAQASPTAQATTLAPVTAPPPKPKKPKVICTEEVRTDSIIPKRVCRTAEQIEAERAQADRLLRSCQGPGC